MMEMKKETLSSLRLCRFCLCEDETITSLYERNRAPKTSIPLTLKILSSVSIEVFPSDKMPRYICNRCRFFMDITYEYKQICRQADENLLQFVQDGASLKSVSWPSALSKVYRMCNKSQPSVMKTVVEGGATVQITANETDSEEADDDNVYNIKIKEGSEVTQGARVKIITSDEKEKPKRKDPAVMKSEEQDSGLQDGRWPCDQCDRTYPLQQLLDLHKTQKHRQRNVDCDKCDAKFFTTYDLMVHQLRHTTESMFQCIVCDKRFKRHILLKRHEKEVHAELPQQPCPHCPATFLSLEELAEHQKKHIRTAPKLYECDICNKRFHEKLTLHRHRENIHNKVPSFACEYCPSRYSSVTKLARHVREHAGDRPYPCKYCDKAFLKSHHYTRHLRQKHRDASMLEADLFRCEECEDTFTTQDDLIYHSAIHATQNLICPLCQEKFDDVDAVTMHIKSHVSGTEFMCDFCELIFTTKEKLNTHMVLSHEDELQNEQELTQDESSMEVDQEDDEDDSGMVVKEAGDHMVVEIKKPDEFLINSIPVVGDVETAVDNTNSEESEPETTYTELATVDTLTMVPKEPKIDKPAVSTLGGAIITKNVIVAKPPEKKENIQITTASIVRKAEDCKRKSLVATPEIDNKKDKPTKAEAQNSNSGANDKSLRLLEKELQELQRTNTRTDNTKTPAKSLEPVRSRRLQIHTSTPKVRTPIVQEEKKVPAPKPAIVEKKVPERRAVTKENKEPKDTKEVKSNNSNAKDEKEKDTPKSVVKNGANEKTPEEGIRRSTRPSKIKDYAKMIKDRSQESDEDDDTDDGDDAEYKESDRNEVKRGRRSSLKAIKPVTSPAQLAASSPAPGTAVRKRGRPRKEVATVPTKVRKDDAEVEYSSTTENIKPDVEPIQIKEEPTSEHDNKTTTSETESTKQPITEQKSSVLVSPTGQTLKKIPIRSLPPGVKALPLPPNARTVNSGEVCEMQIGKKVVKVQKIVMTKAEVEAMAKKGLVEMKDGTMVLKQGIKIPTSDAASLKTTLVEAVKESPSKKEKAAPTRCNLGEDQ